MRNDVDVKASCPVIKVQIHTTHTHHPHTYTTHTHTPPTYIHHPHTYTIHTHTHTHIHHSSVTIHTQCLLLAWSSLGIRLSCLALAGIARACRQALSLHWGSGTQTQILMLTDCGDTRGGREEKRSMTPITQPMPLEETRWICHPV